MNSALELPQVTFEALNMTLTELDDKRLLKTPKLGPGDQANLTLQINPQVGIMYRKFVFVTLDSGYLTSSCNDWAKHTGILFIEIQILVLAN